MHYNSIQVQRADTIVAERGHVQACKDKKMGEELAIEAKKKFNVVPAGL